MSSISIKASAAVTLSYSVHVERVGANAMHKLITFPGMAGAEVLEGEDVYESYRISGWIAGLTMDSIQTASDALELQYRGMRGRTGDMITVSNDDGSSYIVKNLVGESPPSYEQPRKYGTGYIRPVSLTLRRVR